MNNPKLIRITTVPQSLRGLLKGQLGFISENGFEVIGISSPSEILDEVSRDEAVTTIPVEMTRTISPIKDLKALLALIKIFRKEKPNIVHTHTPKAGLLGMMAAKICGVPHRLHTVAGMPLLVATGNKRKLLNFIEKLTYSCATKIYPNSYGLKNIIIEQKFTKISKIKVLGNGSSNGIDTSVFNPALNADEQKALLKESLGISAQDFVFIFVGRLVGDKGLNELVAAFENLNSERAKLILVGSYEPELDPLSSNTMNSINNNPNIISVGYQTDVKPYFGIADVLTFPSYREGFPNVVMQAAAMQLNCIVSDINGCNEIIKDGENGWIVPVKNSEKLQDKMSWCIQNRSTSKNMGIQSRDLMIQNYERAFIWNEILKEYKNLS
ncbi:glycosyltransferase [Flavobacterium sp. NST-5]|uniref:Glycosyltransferase n=1 Tax=Flavobacterium ichthyis TaxID=2698827 RepID=A0ABW9Z9M9_9FLAO|nr:glycosyltransferase family 4 protein [Flavobacterium ichthyis]NBL64820.1 glycosyltransferase [Flavobacterium ichthyis]